MEFGLGKLGWSPDVFWGSTLLELNAASHGLAKFHGAEELDSGITPLSRDEMEELKEKLNA